MDHRIHLIVKKIECVQKLIGPCENRVHRERLAARFEDVGKIFTRDEFHHEELHILFEEMIRHSRERDMLQTIQETSFALDRLAIDVVHEQRLFYRDGAAETFIGSNVHRAHSTLSDLLIYAVTLL